jgi:hypothetical protein
MRNIQIGKIDERIRLPKGNIQVLNTEEEEESKRDPESPVSIRIEIVDSFEMACPNSDLRASENSQLNLERIQGLSKIILEHARRSIDKIELLEKMPVSPRIRTSQQND